MTRSAEPKKTSLDLRAFFRFLEAQYGALRAAGSDKAILQLYLELIDFVKSRSEEEKRVIFPSARARMNKSDKIAAWPEHDDTIRNWSTKEVETALNKDEIDRRHLETIARLRFGLSTGAISALSNKEALRRKLQALIRNERGHESIKRLAEIGPSSGNDS
jgi:hypothetical protein